MYSAPVALALSLVLSSFPSTTLSQPTPVPSACLWSSISTTDPGIAKGQINFTPLLQPIKSTIVSVTQDLVKPHGPHHNALVRRKAALVTEHMARSLNALLEAVSRQFHVPHAVDPSFDAKVYERKLAHAAYKALKEVVTLEDGDVAVRVLETEFEFWAGKAAASYVGFQIRRCHEMLDWHPVTNAV